MCKPVSFLFFYFMIFIYNCKIQWNSALICFNNVLKELKIANVSLFLLNSMINNFKHKKNTREIINYWSKVNCKLALEDIMNEIEQ